MPVNTCFFLFAPDVGLAEELSMWTEPGVSEFDEALIRVSELLADARSLEARGRGEDAVTMYALAESCAVQGGFVELMHLVWAYAPAAPVSAAAAALPLLSNAKSPGRPASGAA